LLKIFNGKILAILAYNSMIKTFMPNNNSV